MSECVRYKYPICISWQDITDFFFFFGYKKGVIIIFEIDGNTWNYITVQIIFINNIFWSYNCLQRIMIINYLKLNNCVQIISVWLEYLKLYNYLQKYGLLYSAGYKDDIGIK